MGYVAMGMSALSGLAGAGSSLMGGNATAAADRYQAQVAQNNAARSAQAADVVQQQGQVQAQSYYQQGDQRMAAARAGYGASGVDVNSGSALDAQSSIARTTAQNVNAVGYDADVQAVGYRNQAANYQTQAGLDLASARQAKTAGLLGAASSLIGSASAVSSKWDMFKNAGALGGSSLTGTTSADLTGIDGTKLAAMGGANPWAAAMLPAGA